MRLLPPARRRTLAVSVALCLALGSAASLASGLVSCARPEPRQQVESVRPLTAAEAGRLAGMRQHNYQEGRVGLAATLGQGTTEVALSGWVDWRQPLVYLAVTGRTPGAADGLVQAVPGAIAQRPGRLAQTAADPAPRPPVVAPPDGWRVRRFGPIGPTGSPLDGLLALLFVVAADRPDAADRLARGEARWLRRDHAGPVPVDVLLGPAVPPTPGPDLVGPRLSPTATGAASLADQGGAVRYWLDAEGRLLRLEATVGRNVPLWVDFHRADQPTLTAIDALGGRPVQPRPVTAAEADTLARLRQRDRTAGGGPVSLVLPAGAGHVVSASGWLDWRAGVAYLLVGDSAQPDDLVLVRADRTGMAALPGAAATPDGRPPLPPPRGAWQRTEWADRADAGGVTDLDLLLTEALTLTSGVRDDKDFFIGTAVWLRADVLAGVPVTGYEIPKPAERGRPRGLARLRYWVDESGVLRRLEVRTRTGGFGQLDVHPGDLPYLPPARSG